MKTVFSVIIFCCVSLSLIAQNITGKVTNIENQPIEFANVALYSLPDSTLITETVTDSKGDFSINTNRNLVDAFLRISFSGFETHILQLRNLPSKTNLGLVLLHNRQLSEVTVTAERSIAKTDRQLIFPAQQVVRTSTDGFDFLNKLMLPGLKVDIVNKSIAKAGGGSVPIYINDKKATQADVIALRPDEVLRVEYIDAPGVRYANDNAEAVVNFVVKQRVSGILTGINTTNAVTTGNGNNLYYLKYNHKQSEFGINYSMNYGAVAKRYINQTDTYILPDNSQHIVKREGINTKLRYDEHRLQLTYNLSVPNKYVFETNLRGTFYDSPNRGHKQRISETNKPTYYSLTEPTEKYHSSVIDLFYRVNLPKRQAITANLVGTYIGTTYGYSFKTFENAQFTNPTGEYGYNTDGEKYSLIGELRYNKQFDNVTFVTGIDHLEGYTKNQYSGSNNVVNKMRNANTYLYSQIQGKFSKVSYIAGLGLSYQTYSQNNDEFRYWLFRPSLTLSYSPFKGANMRYRFYIRPRIPGLALLSDVSQQVNDMEFRLGNPNLKPYFDMTNTLFFSYQHKRFYVENTIGYTRSDNAIMEQIFRKTNSLNRPFFEFSFENQKGLNQFWNYIAGQYYIIPEKLTIQGGLSYLTYSSKGNTYSHRHSRIWGVFQVDLTLDKWNVGVNYNSEESSLSGETVSYGSDYSNLYANYRLNNNMTFGVNWSYILKKNGHTSGDKTSSKFVNKELNVLVPDWGNMVSVSFSWNFNKGREYSSQRRTINNSDTESGVFKY